MGIEVDRKRRQVCWQAHAGRNITEVEVKVFDLASPFASQTDFGASADRPAHLCHMAGEAGADGIDAGGDADGAGVIIVIVVATTDAWGDVLRHHRSAVLRDALDDIATRTADGARSLDPADGETPRGIDQRARRGSCAKTRAQCSEPLQSLRHACGHWRIEAGGAGRRIASRAGAIEGRCSSPLL